MTDIKGQVGEAAGQVWHVLFDGGPHTLALLRKKLKGSAEILDFAIGWLAREDKIDIIPEKKSYRIQLR